MIFDSLVGQAHMHRVFDEGVLSGFVVVLRFRDVLRIQILLVLGFLKNCFTPALS